MTLRSRAVSFVGALALVGGGWVATSAPAQAAACSSTDGVTVIVESSAGTSVRCAPGNPSSAWAALTSAGFSLTPVQRFPGAVCRIDGYPASDPCFNMPPASAYWSFWHAPVGGGGWTYSQLGIASYDPAPGQSVGFRFGSGQQPSIAAANVSAPAPAPPAPAPAAPKPQSPATTAAPATGGGTSGGTGSNSGGGTSAGNAPSNGSTGSGGSSAATPGSGNGNAAGSTPGSSSSAAGSGNVASSSPSASGSASASSSARPSASTSASTAAPTVTSTPVAAQSRTKTQDSGAGRMVLGIALVALLAAAAGLIAWQRRRV